MVEKKGWAARPARIEIEYYVTEDDKAAYDVKIEGDVAMSVSCLGCGLRLLADQLNMPLERLTNAAYEMGANAIPAAKITGQIDLKN